ncbi:MULTISPECIES: M48 family metalloprotease [Bacillus]|uniref:M48 family metalloprotease n=1 Tax=Bacillus TaxID=1386 RepID=UPI00201BAEB4|nr:MULTISPECIES: M48 family metalloprotease [Bacillus]
MEVRKTKFNYLYIVWSGLTVLISIMIFRTLFPLALFPTVLLFLSVYGLLFFMNYGLFGDWRNRIRAGLRRPATIGEKEYLERLNDEVFISVQRHYPHVKKADLFLIDDEGINAFALGFKTIGLTSAAMRNLSDGELKAVLAHEYAHLAFKDTLHLVMFNSSFTILSIALLPLYVMGFFICFILGCIEGLLNGGSNPSVSGGLLNIFFRLVGWCYITYCRLGFYFVNIGSRDFEYRAGEVAAKAGFGDELLEFFYRIEREHIDVRKGFIALLASTHPYTAYRIENIESFLNGVRQEY